MSARRRRPRAAYLLLAALAFQGSSGLVGGFGLITDPSGGRVGLPRAWLAGSPFDDYLIPGWVLLVILGVIPLIIGWALWGGRRWSPWGAALVGAALIVWIAVQIQVVGYRSDPPLQAIYGALGAVIVALALTPSVRQYAAAGGSVQANAAERQ